MYLWFTLQPFTSRKIYHLASNHMFRAVCLLWFRCFSFYFFSLSQWRTWKLSLLFSCLLFLSQPLKHPNTAEDQFLFSFNWSFGEKSQPKDRNLLTNLLWPAQISSLPKKVLTLRVEWAFWCNYCSPRTQTHTYTHARACRHRCFWSDSLVVRLVYLWMAAGKFLWQEETAALICCVDLLLVRKQQTRLLER